MIKNFVEELRWRGMLHDIVPGSEELLSKKSTKAYIGFDPTADSLHIGNLVQIMTLMHFQRCGHKPFALVGGATGMVGDPSGKSRERNLIALERLNHNLAGIKKQLMKFLNFEGENAAEIVNNYDWFRDFNFLDFIRDVGKHISINYMLSKESVKNRMESGMSFTEFSYQLVQGYDFYYLWKNKNIELQLGGSDQWGNIVTGTELIRKISRGNAFAVTTPLITKSDGSKFGKTESGNIWLDKSRTSPYLFYQYWINTSDEDAKNYVKIFSIRSKEEIFDLIEQHDVSPHQRLVQKTLAEELTTRVHSKEELFVAEQASEIIFGNTLTKELSKIDEKTLLEVFEGVPQCKISRDDLERCGSVTELLSNVSRGVIFPSKGEAKRMIKSGGVSINKSKIESPDQPVDFPLLQNRYLIAQKGKKNYYLISVV